MRNKQRDSRSNDKHPNSGKSFSKKFPTGKRARFKGEDLAPRSARNQVRFLKDCTESQLRKARLLPD